jgi:hypothetical protein
MRFPTEGKQRQNAERLSVPLEASERRGLAIQFLLGQMAEWRMPEIVGQCRCLGRVGVQHVDGPRGSAGVASSTLEALREPTGALSDFQ